MTTTAIVLAVFATHTTMARSGGAQTASALHDRARRAEAADVAAGRSVQGASVSNPWVLGTQFGGQLFGDGELNDDLLVAAKFVVPVVTSKHLNLATFGNFSSFIDEFDPSDEEKREEAITSQLTSSRGLLFGTQLYDRFPIPKTDWLALVPFGQVDFRISRAQTTDTAAVGAADDEKVSATLLQRRAGFGLEAQIGNQGEGSRPLTLTFSRTRTWADSAEFASVFGDRTLQRYVNEYTAIFPVGQRFGVVVEMAHAGKGRDVYRIAILAVTGKTDDDDDGDGDSDASKTPASGTFTLTIDPPASGGGTITPSWGTPAKNGTPCTISAGQTECTLVELPLKTPITLRAEAAQASKLVPWHKDANCSGATEQQPNATATCMITVDREAKRFPAPFASN